MRYLGQLGLQYLAVLVPSDLGRRVADDVTGQGHVLPRTGIHCVLQLSPQLRQCCGERVNSNVNGTVIFLAL